MSASVKCFRSAGRNLPTAFCVSLVLLASSAYIGYAQAQTPRVDHLVRDRYGAIIRGDQDIKKLALVFTGDEYGESFGPILDTLSRARLRRHFSSPAIFCISRCCDRF